jgi:transposase
MMESTAMGRRQVQAVEMLPLLKRHEIQVLLRAGHSQRDVAERTGASLDTVSRVMREDEVDAVDDAAERRKRRIGRPSKATPFAPRVSEWLTQEPELPTQELLRRAKEIGYTGHKTAFYALVAGARPPRSIPIVRFEGLPGEFSQHDFGHVDVTFVGGRKKRVHFFASRLKYLRFVAVSRPARSDEVLVFRDRVGLFFRTLRADDDDRRGGGVHAHREGRCRRNDTQARPRPTKLLFNNPTLPGGQIGVMKRDTAAGARGASRGWLARSELRRPRPKLKVVASVAGQPSTRLRERR